jgi:hypothetical protein
MYQQRYKGERKDVRKQKVVHENASMTFDKSQYARADTKRAQMSGRIKVVGKLLTGAILRACSSISKGITLDGAKRVATHVVSQELGEQAEKPHEDHDANASTSSH